MRECTLSSPTRGVLPYALGCRKVTCVTWAYWYAALNAVGIKFPRYKILVTTSMNSWPGTGTSKARARKYPRVKVSIPAEARHVMENFPRRGQTTNLSEGGCYIEMVQTLEPPTCVDVVLWLNDEKVQARAEVVTRNAHLGNGIRFIRISDGDKLKLRTFVETAQKNHGLPFRGPGRLDPMPE
jgi:PilZ domain